MNSSGAVGDILAFTFVSRRDNTVRKYIGLVVVAVVKKHFLMLLGGECLPVKI